MKKSIPVMIGHAVFPCLYFFLGLWWMWIDIDTALMFLLLAEVVDIKILLKFGK